MSVVLQSRSFVQNWWIRRPQSSENNNLQWNSCIPGIHLPESLHGSPESQEQGSHPWFGVADPTDRGFRWCCRKRMQLIPRCSAKECHFECSERCSIVRRSIPVQRQRNIGNLPIWRRAYCRQYFCFPNLPVAGRPLYFVSHSRKKCFVPQVLWFRLLGPDAVFVW